MLSLPSFKVFTLWRFESQSPPKIKLTPVAVHDIEKLPNKRARTLKHLVKLNHANHSILYHDLQYHNHLPHILGSAFLLGSNEAQLEGGYEENAKELEKWEASPSEITRYDWRDFLGDARYQRAYVDFFEDELIIHGYDWQNLIKEYLFQGDKPLVNCLVSGLGHPLIHLGYAYELSSRELAIEALAMAATSYSHIHKYLDDPKHSVPQETTSLSIGDLLSKMVNDKRLKDIFSHKGAGNIEKLLAHHEKIVMEYWNSWSLEENALEQFSDAQAAAVSMFAATQSDDDSSYDFFLVHILTTSHAVRILLSFLPAKFQIPLLRQWWLLTVVVYISQLCPPIVNRSILDYDIQHRNWSAAIKEATEGKWANDAHFVKAIRALHVANDTWDNSNDFFLKAALKFSDQFTGWSGFGVI